MVIVDNDPGDENDDKGFLEELITHEANKLLTKSERHPSGRHEFFTTCRREVENTFTLPYKAHKNITNYLIDSYKFHSRHKESDKKDSIKEMYRDTFKYLVQLSNGYPLTYRRMSDS